VFRRLVPPRPRSRDHDGLVVLVEHSVVSINKLFIAIHWVRAWLVAQWSRDTRGIEFSVGEKAETSSLTEGLPLETVLDWNSGLGLVIFRVHSVVVRQSVSGDVMIRSCPSHIVRQAALHTIGRPTSMPFDRGCHVTSLASPRHAQLIFNRKHRWTCVFINVLTKKNCWKNKCWCYQNETVY